MCRKKYLFVNNLILSKEIVSKLSCPLYVEQRNELKLLCQGYMVMQSGTTIYGKMLNKYEIE